MLNRRTSRPLLVFALGLAWLGAGCRQTSATPPAPAALSPDTWAVVNGRTISRSDVDKAFRRLQDPSDTPSEEEALAAKLNLLNDLIVQDLLLERARALKLEIPPSEFDAAYAKRKENLSDDNYQQELKRRNLSIDDMREGLRREMLSQKVIDQEVGSKVSISDQMVTDFFNANRAQFNVPEEAYHLAQIVVTTTRDARLANGTGDDAVTPQAAEAKVRMLMEKLKGGTSFRDLAVGYSEDPETAPRGGDLGMVGISQLRKLPPQLQKAVLDKTPGTVNVVPGNGGYTLVLIVSREPAGQRDLSTPGLRDQITQTLRNRREQLLRMAYLTALRNDAQIVNHLARQVTESSGAVPSPPAPLTPPK